MKLSLKGAFKKMPHIFVNHETMTYKHVSTMCYLGYKDSIAWTGKKIKRYFEKNEKIFSTFSEKFPCKIRKKEKKEEEKKKIASGCREAEKGVVDKWQNIR